MPEEKKNNEELDAQLEDLLADDNKNAEANPTSLDGKASSVSADPFARLAKKKVAKPKSMNEVMKKKVKKWWKISPKFFLIGCGFFLIIMLGMMFAWLYYAVSSAGVLESIGLEIEDVKTILMIFAVLFFWLIFFLGFYILVLNVYRLVTVKWKKIKYAVWLVWGIILLIWTIILGTMSITRIRALAWTQEIQSTNLVLTYVETKDGNVFAEDGIPLIAPLNMNFTINTTSNADIMRQIVQSIERRQPLEVELDCGNGQILTMDGQGRFGGSCLFLEKQQYDFILRVTTAEWMQEYSAAGFTPQAVVNLEVIEDESYFNDNKTEYIIGIAPVTMRVRGQKLFTDLDLENDRIVWDFDDDGRVDIEDNTAFEYAYTESRLHTVSYQLPELSNWSDTRFTFDLRVVESELARCELQLEEIDPRNNTWRVTPTFDESIRAQSYHYIITDALTESIIEKKKESKDSTLFTLPSGGMYNISASYFTSDKQKWTCVTEQVETWFVWNQVSFDLKWRQKQNEPFVDVGQGTPVLYDEDENLIAVTTIPATLEFSVTDVQPDPTAQVTVFYQWRQIFAENDTIYEVELSTLWTKELVFEIETKQGDTSEQSYTIDVNRSTVKANIAVEPNTVGEDPFNVSLDASVSALYDEEDEIVYFTWDFGDGESRENISQWKVNHVYTYNEETNKWEYYPSVTVRTKLWFEDTYRMETPITVKRKQKEVIVRADSHPTQQVKAWEKVDFSVETDGLVNRIDWNFGNQKTFGCDDRSCMQTSNRYLTPGEYEITAEVQYESDTPVVWRVKIKVYE